MAASQSSSSAEEPLLEDRLLFEDPEDRLLDELEEPDEELADRLLEEPLLEDRLLLEDPEDRLLLEELLLPELLALGWSERSL